VHVSSDLGKTERGVEPLRCPHVLWCVQPPQADAADHPRTFLGDEKGAIGFGVLGGETRELLVDVLELACCQIQNA
jgi:hypothetical protein